MRLLTFSTPLERLDCMAAVLIVVTRAPLSVQRADFAQLSNLDPGKADAGAFVEPVPQVQRDLWAELVAELSAAAAVGATGLAWLVAGDVERADSPRPSYERLLDAQHLEALGRAADQPASEALSLRPAPPETPMVARPRGNAGGPRAYPTAGSMSLQGGRPRACVMD